MSVALALKSILNFSLRGGPKKWRGRGRRKKKRESTLTPTPFLFPFPPNTLPVLTPTTQASVQRKSCPIARN